MEFVRGDTIALKTLIKLADNQPVSKQDLTELYITCKKNEYSENTIFQKTLEDVEIDEQGYCHIIFRPEDTQTLGYGNYFCDIELTTKSGIRKTKVFEITLTKEATFHNGGDEVE